MRTILLSSLLTASPLAWSHPGHGLGSIHLHAIDYLLMVAVVILAVRLIRR